MGIFSCKQNGAENEMPQSDELIIAFGSCAHSYDTLKIMDAVVSNNPAIWVWLGDIVYGDTHDMNVLAEKYNRQKSKSEYRNLMSTSEIIGVWDDHDYGVNDAGKNYSKRDESKELLLDFLEVSDSDKIRSHDGVYSDYDYTFD
jgi:alkaline phosphatase D